MLGLLSGVDPDRVINPNPKWDIEFQVGDQQALPSINYINYKLFENIKQIT